MKKLLVLAGVVFMLKAAVDGIALVSSFAVADIHSASAAGYVTGQALAALAFLAAGVGCILRGRAVAKARSRSAG